MLVEYVHLKQWRESPPRGACHSARRLVDLPTRWCARGMDCHRSHQRYAQIDGERKFLYDWRRSSGGSVESRARERVGSRQPRSSHGAQLPHGGAKECWPYGLSNKYHIYILEKTSKLILSLSAFYVSRSGRAIVV